MGLFFKFKKKKIHMGGQTKGDLGGEFFSFEKRRTHGCCGRLPWLLVPGWQLQWLFLLALLIVTIFRFSRCMSRCIWLFWFDIDIRPPGAGHAFLRQWHMHNGRVIYFCQGFFPCMMPSMDGWHDGWMDRWKVSFRPRRLLIYVICTYICLGHVTSLLWDLSLVCIH